MRAGDTHAVLRHGHRKYEPDRHLVGERNGARQRNCRHHRRERENIMRPRASPSRIRCTVKAASAADKTLTANSSVTLQNPIPVPQT